MSDDTPLTDEQKKELRDQMVTISKTLIGIPYKIGKTQEDWDSGVGQWRDLSKLPVNLDCEGMAHGICAKIGLKFPPFAGSKKNGAQQQFDFTVATSNPKPGDFAFFGHGKNVTDIYHVGMVYDENDMIEARGHQEGASFKTGEVIFRARKTWEAFSSFCGYRSHPKLV